jgi:chromosome segregation ATPase
MPIDKLKFEYEKRQRKISTLQIQLSRNTQEYDQLQEDWNDEYNSRRSQGRGALNDFDASGFQGGSNHLMSQISACEGEIRQLEAEMTAIEEAMETNWK